MRVAYTAVLKRVYLYGGTPRPAVRDPGLPLPAALGLCRGGQGPGPGDAEAGGSSIRAILRNGLF